jgi:hypothetical protein
MAEVTWLDLQTRVAKRLQLIADAESLPANYAADIQAAIRSVQAQASELGIASRDAENGLDHAFVDPFVDLTCAELADEFGVPEPRRTMLRSQALGLPGRSAAERRLRALFPSPKPQTTHDMPVM